jgi:uncharacterized protein (TIGR02186 family)
MFQQICILLAGVKIIKMKRFLFLFIVLSTVWAIKLSSPAQAGDITVNLSDPIVKITAGFSGTDLLIFGVVPSDGDVIIVVRGPIRKETVRKKDKVMGVWVNRDKIVLENVPSLYMTASNRSVDEFMPDGIAYTHQIGAEYIRIKPHKDYAHVKDWERFRHALIRNKVKQNLYKQEAAPLVFLGNRLFRTKLHFPSNVSVGTFGIETYLIRQGKIAAFETTLLNVRKFGIEADIYNFAHRHSLAYGLLAIIVAGLAGWMANAAFRKA